MSHESDILKLAEEQEKLQNEVASLDNVFRQILDSYPECGHMTCYQHWKNELRKVLNDSQYTEHLLLINTSVLQGVLDAQKASNTGAQA